jgi:hypothetical protein
MNAEVTPLPQTDAAQWQHKHDTDPPAEAEKVLCPHCLRTATNGIKCKGICVADSDY